MQQLTENSAGCAEHSAGPYAGANCLLQAENFTTVPQAVRGQIEQQLTSAIASCGQHAAAHMLKQIAQKIKQQLAKASAVQSLVLHHVMVQIAQCKCNIVQQYLMLCMVKCNIMYHK